MKKKKTKKKVTKRQEYDLKRMQDENVLIQDKQTYTTYTGK